MDKIVLTPEQEARQPLLERLATILVSGDINDDVYREFSWALSLGRLLFPTQPLIVRFNGSGGEVTPTMGIVDLIQADGNVWGVALGRVVSCTSVLWAACSRRYIAPNAAVCLHAVTMPIEGSFNAGMFRELADDADFMDERNIAIYTAASNRDVDFWRAAYFGSTEHLEILPAEIVVGELGMAFPLGRLEADLMHFHTLPTTTGSTLKREDWIKNELE